MSLRIDTSLNDDLGLISIEGEIDVSNANELREAIDGLLTQRPAGMVVDLAHVAYIDSTGIGVLVGAVHRAKEAGIPFEVANPQRNVVRVLSLLGVDGELGIR